MVSCTFYDSKTILIKKPSIFLVFVNFFYLKNILYLNKIIKKDIHQANVLSDESDNELISSNNRTVNNRYALAKKNDPTAYENTIENAKSSKKDNSNSELNRSLSNLSLKSEMVAQISNKFEEYESEFKLTASKSFKNQDKVSTN